MDIDFKQGFYGMTVLAIVLLGLVVYAALQVQTNSNWCNAFIKNQSRLMENYTNTTNTILLNYQNQMQYVQNWWLKPRVFNTTDFPSNMEFPVGCKKVIERPYTDCNLTANNPSPCYSCIRDNPVNASNSTPVIPLNTSMINTPNRTGLNTGRGWFA